MDLHPNERWACAFEINRHGRVTYDLPPTLVVITNDKASSLENALTEKHPDLLYGWARPYNKTHDKLIKKGYAVRSTFLFTDYDDCVKKYRQMVDTYIDRAQAVIAACKERLVRLPKKGENTSCPN